MGANPFLDQDKVDEIAKEVLDDGDDHGESESVGEDGAPVESSGEADPFLDDADDDEDEAPEDEDDDLLEDEEGDEDEPEQGKKAEPETVPYKRLVKELKKRTELQEQLAEAQGVQLALAEAYKGFDDPAKQMQWDSRFMAALEQLSKHNIPGLNAVVQAAEHFMKTGEVLTVDAKGTVTTEKAKAPERDPRIDAIIERDASRLIDDTLPANMRPAFRAVAKDYVLGVAADLSALDADDVRSLVREFVKEKGFTKEDIYTSAKPEADKGPRKPPTASGRSGKPATATKGKDAKAPERQAPKSLDEWEAQQEARMAAFASERSLS